MEWRVYKGDRNNFIWDKLIPHYGAIGQSSYGPFMESEKHLKVREVYQNGEWNFDRLFFMIQEKVKSIIRIHKHSSDESKKILKCGVSPTMDFSPQILPTSILRKQVKANAMKQMEIQMDLGGKGAK